MVVYAAVRPLTWSPHRLLLIAAHPSRVWFARAARDVSWLDSWLIDAGDTRRMQRREALGEDIHQPLDVGVACDSEVIRCPWSPAAVSRRIAATPHCGLRMSSTPTYGSRSRGCSWTSGHHAAISAVKRSLYFDFCASVFNCSGLLIQSALNTSGGHRRSCGVARRELDLSTTVGRSRSGGCSQPVRITDTPCVGVQRALVDCPVAHRPQHASELAVVKWSVASAGRPPKPSPGSRPHRARACAMR